MFNLPWVFAHSNLTPHTFLANPSLPNSKPPKCKLKKQPTMGKMQGMTVINMHARILTFYDQKKSRGSD